MSVASSWENSTGRFGIGKASRTENWSVSNSSKWSSDIQGMLTYKKIPLFAHLHRYEHTHLRNNNRLSKCLTKIYIHIEHWVVIVINLSHWDLMTRFQFWYRREIDDEIFKKPESTERAKMEVWINGHISWWQMKLNFYNIFSLSVPSLLDILKIYSTGRAPQHASLEHDILTVREKFNVLFSKLMESISSPLTRFYFRGER